MPTKATKMPKKIVERIAKEILRLEAIETRNLDRLDFSDQAVWRLVAALEAAYAAGVEAGSKR